ncbi:MAG: rhomboid family intramembrane serine protease [Oscillospiraceae bacterium]|jgi:hypothetical protein|nr:rhomboid family intramembrane serine protease [Oscillospiraceae bacterium]
MKKIDMFCYRHPRFGVRNLMLIIVIGTAAVWLLSMMDRSGQLLGLLSFSPTAILHGQIWRLVTFVFVPTNSGIWLLISLYFYYFVGSVLEREWGAGRFTIFYLSGMLLTIVYGFIVYFAAGLPVPLSTVYINYSLFFAFATLYPDNMVLLFFFIPLKMKWLAWLDAAYFAYSILDGLISLPGTLKLLGIMPVIAILNYLLFFGSTLGGLFRPRAARRKTVNFQQELHRMKKDAKQKNYMHKCAVCGRTDADYPELEFRYCSRCAGYHCFCQDHINNHVHFTE